MSKIEYLKSEREKINKVIGNLSPQDRQTYEKCFVDGIAGYDVKRVMGIDRRTLSRRKAQLISKMSQNLT